MKDLGDRIARSVGLAMAGSRSPWGNQGKGGDAGGEPGSAAPEGGDGPAEGSSGDGPRNPWQGGGETPPRRAAGIEEIFRQRRRGGGGGGGGSGGGFSRLLQPGPGGWLKPALAALALVWLGGSTYHQLGSTEQGIVTTFGKYSHTIGSGVSFTLPWPAQSVSVEDVTSIQRDTIPEGEGEKLMLTSDQNLVDLSYLVRWNIKDLKLYTFQLSDPRLTVREVAEAAMRASVAEEPLNEVMGGAGRARIEAAVGRRMQALLDAYHSGVLVQGVEIKKADPPDRVNDAFQKVTAAQQDAQRDQNVAQAWAQQTLARAEGEAAAFDKVYAQYKLAPEVTRRRMYYETMERVLSANDKVVVETQGGVTSYLPLPELRRKAAQKPAEGGQ